MKRIFMLFSIGVMAMSASLSAQTSVDVQAQADSAVQTSHKEFMSGARTYFGQLMQGQENRLADMMSSIDGYIDFFASQDFSTLPDWELPIMDLVKEGRFDEGIRRYEGRKMLNDYTPGSSMFESIERYVMLLQLSGVRQNSMHGIDILQKIVSVDSVSQRPMRAIVNLAMDLRLQSMADEYLTLYQYRAAGDARQTAAVYSLRAQMLNRRNRPNEAMVYARRSLIIYDSLMRVTNNPKFELIDRARAHQVLGRIYYRLEEVETSLSHIRSCRQCFALDAENGSGIHLTERIRVLYNLAPLAADQNAFFLADSIYTEVDQLGSWLFEGSEYKQNQFLFNSLRLRGLACYRVGKSSESRSYFNQAEEVLQKLEAMAPGQNVENFQNLYFNIASLYYSEGNIEMALDMDRKVLDMVQRDTTHDPRRHAVDLCYCHKYIGNCLWALGYEKYLASNRKKTKEVMRYYREAYDNYGLAIEYNSRDAEAQAKYNLGDLIISGMEKPMEMPKNF